MHFYKFHINDYSVQTRHLSNEEDLCFRRLLDLYYTEEGPIPLETDWVARRIQVRSEVLLAVLRDFFIETEKGWINGRADAEIAEYHAVCARNAENGKRGGRPSATKRKPKGNPTASQRKTSLTLSLISNQESNISPVVPGGDESLPGEDELPEPATHTDYSHDFLSFWESFPEKKGKGAAWRIWCRIKGRPPVTTLIEAIRLQEVDRAAAQAKGDFYPEWKNPATWLRGACWEDGLKYAAKKEKAPAAAPENWRELLVDEYPENYPDGLASANFPSAFHLLPHSVQADLRLAAHEREELARAIRETSREAA
jgi:uncharacterized protein YdaU (DUF1376 family)